ncbi:hypothetical protein N8I77_004935 [Diaporthe amygdali]|uniref:Uncharacterized protein n=1 Tax=Phomopsis amygdali TaxID=1214568 RepID=A0AAD9W6H4_PHOAM|nr:hypothetical protein N8I77_004935 [Diaporthe amygdali]
MQTLKKEMPDIGKEWTVFEGDEARNISLMPEVTGIMTGTATNGGRYLALPISHPLPEVLARHIPQLLSGYQHYRIERVFRHQLLNRGDINTGSADTPNILSHSGPPDHITASYLDVALSNYFGYTNWGPERTDFPQGAMDANVYPGRTKRV